MNASRLHLRSLLASVLIVVHQDWDRKLTAYSRIVGGGGVKGLVETLPWFELFMLACQALRDVRISSVARFLRFDA